VAVAGDFAEGRQGGAIGDGAGRTGFELNAIAPKRMASLSSARISPAFRLVMFWTDAPVPPAKSMAWPVNDLISPLLSTVTVPPVTAPAWI
jgi:hypothetical protein